MSKFLNNRVLLLCIACLLSAGFNSAETTEIRNFKNYYDAYQVNGSFVLYDQNNNHYILYNEQQFNQPFIPASTYKICNSLIGLETGVIPDENYIIQWDSVMRKNPNWNFDQDMKTAFKNSTVWYYQELARRVGGEKMKYWLDKAGYGNADTSGGIDQFWLTGGLRITPAQQIDFLIRLHENKLPFSQRSMDIVKKIMIQEEDSNYILRGKTGWGMMQDTDIGWYAGYLETNNNVYYFANCIQSSDPNNQNFGMARTAIADSILRVLKLKK